MDFVRAARNRHFSRSETNTAKNGRGKVACVATQLYFRKAWQAALGRLLSSLQADKPWLGDAGDQKTCVHTGSSTDVLSRGTDTYVYTYVYMASRLTFWDLLVTSAGVSAANLHFFS